MIDLALVAAAASRGADARAEIPDDEIDAAETWTTTSRAGVRLRIPPACEHGATLTIEEFRIWSGV